MNLANYLIGEFLQGKGAFDKMDVNGFDVEVEVLRHGKPAHAKIVRVLPGKDHDAPQQCFALCKCLAKGQFCAGQQGNCSLSNAGRSGQAVDKAPL